jgi:predicted nucleotidyltransferase
VGELERHETTLIYSFSIINESERCFMKNKISSLESMYDDFRLNKG